MSLEEKLERIRSSPKLQSQQQAHVVLNAIDDTLRSQNSDRTPTAYFAALLSLLGQYISTERGTANKDLAYAVVYLLGLVTCHVPQPLLRSKFSQVLASLALALTHTDADAPLLRASIGCLESLLIAQDTQAWALPQSPTSPRGAFSGLLALALDPRPKVRKRAQDAIANVLHHPPPSPSLDHPVADMCAEVALRNLQKNAEEASQKRKKHRSGDEQEYAPGLMHAMRLVKVVANAANGWPSRKIDELCEVLLSVSKSSNEFLIMTAFEVFETIFTGLADEVSSAKLPKLLEAINELQPSQNDSQLLPPWIAVLSRAYDISAQIRPDETFQNLPKLFVTISAFLTSSSHNIRASAAECLISLLHTCVPDTVILEPSIMDEKVLESLGKNMEELMAVRFQPAWMEIFNIFIAAFEVLRWQTYPLLTGIVRTIGDFRGDDSFAGKKEADAVLAAAIRAMGPDNLTTILPLNLAKPLPGQPGRAWLLPLLRDSVSNTHLAHFRTEMVPLSEIMFQRVLNHGSSEKTMEIKIFETVVAQIWACLPGYCELPLDLPEAFDQSFAELLSNLLYQQPQLRSDICRALQNLVDTNSSIENLEGEEDLIQQGRISRDKAKRNIQHLATFSSNLLAVLFNVYSQTLPHNRGNLLNCINSYLSITPEAELLETFQRVASMLESAVAEAEAQQENKPQKQQQMSSEQAKDKMPPTSHTLMDLVITMSIYLPRQSFVGLFSMAANIVNKDTDAQLQKKAYKLIPRLATSKVGLQAIEERNQELQQFLLAAGDKASAPARRDRLAAIAQVVPFLPASDLHFIPSILSEVVISAKEVNEKARGAAFDLLVLMGEKMKQGGTVVNAKVPHMPADAPPAVANLEEYFTMVSAGLAGSTPQMVSASITALTRLLFEFRSSMKNETITDLVQTMDLFLTSNNREIVRSVLGFVKVCIISLPTELVGPRLKTLVPNLVVWSHEHKAHFKAKVKHIFERMIRRFGVDVIEKYTPEADRKLIANIRKTRERRKRKMSAADMDDDSDAAMGQRKQGKFESGFDEAVYGSESDEDSDISDNEVLGRAVAKGRRAKQNGGQQYIVEDDDEPLDLLDRKALAHISSTRPVRNTAVPVGRKRAKTDIDGKLVFKESESDSGSDAAEDMDSGRYNIDAAGIGAYVNAIRGKDAAQRGQRGRLKFKNNRRAKEGGDDDDDMDVDDENAQTGHNGNRSGFRGGHRGRSRGRGGFGGDNRPQRRGLDGEKLQRTGVDGFRGGRGGGIRKFGPGRGGGGPGGRGFARQHGLQSRRGRGRGQK